LKDDAAVATDDEDDNGVNSMLFILSWHTPWQHETWYCFTF